MVNVFPLPVCPYANTLLLYPLKALSTYKVPRSCVVCKKTYVQFAVSLLLFFSYAGKAKSGNEGFMFLFLGISCCGLIVGGMGPVRCTLQWTDLENSRLGNKTPMAIIMRPITIVE